MNNWKQLSRWGLHCCTQRAEAVKILEFRTRRAQGTHRTRQPCTLTIGIPDILQVAMRQVLIVLGISLAKRVICHMTTRVLDVILTDGTYHN